MIKRIDEDEYGVYINKTFLDADIPIEIYTQSGLINKISKRNHPIDDQLIDIVKNMKVGESTTEPQAFYGNFRSVNGVPKREK